MVSMGKLAFLEGAKRAERLATTVMNVTVVIASRAHLHLLRNMIVVLNMYRDFGGERHRERKKGWCVVLARVAIIHYTTAGVNLPMWVKRVIFGQSTRLVLSLYAVPLIGTNLIYKRFFTLV